MQRLAAAKLLLQLRAEVNKKIVPMAVVLVIVQCK